MLEAGIICVYDRLYFNAYDRPMHFLQVPIENTIPFQ